MCCLAVYRHADLWPHPFVHALQFAATWMTGDMHKRIAVLDDLHAKVDKAVLDLQDRLFIAGDSTR